MFKRFFPALAGLALGAFLLQGAQATVVVTGAGTWGAAATTSTFSAAGASWSFSFLLPDLVTTNPTTQFSAFSYSLNGIQVATPATAIEFYTSADSGMFDIDFGSTRAVSFYGPIVLASSVLVHGRYDVFAGLDGSVSTGSGTITLQPVPEPSTWLLVAGGLAAVGVVARRRRPARS